MHEEIDGEEIDGELARALAVEAEKMGEVRRDLHAHPQLAFDETYASRIVQENLQEAGVAFQGGVAGTGVVAWIPPDGELREDAIALRADMDALPLEEKSGLSHASSSPGTMHACGHDGHMAMLLGAGRVLAKMRSHLLRPVKLIFQPGEETGGGAEKMIQAGALDERTGGLRAASVFGLHGWPGLPQGTLATRAGALMASTDLFRITVHGKGGHGSSPELTVDPIVTTAQIITAVQSIVSRNLSPLVPGVISFGVVRAGEAANVIPECAALTGTIRALDEGTARELRRRLITVTESVAHAHGASAVIDVKRGCPATCNDPAAVEFFLRAAKACREAREVRLLEKPVMASEDFSVFSRQVPACFFFLGLDRQDPWRNTGLHTSEFDFNDAAIPAGIEALCRLALQGGPAPSRK